MLKEHGLECRLPNDTVPIDAGIYAVKVRRWDDAVSARPRSLTTLDQSCTEMVVALDDMAEFRDVTVDASAALARMALKRCGTHLSRP